MEKEIWKPWIKNPNYLVSNYGNVKGKRGHLLKLTLEQNYYCVSTRLPGERTAKRTRVHRMVMETFCPCENMENLFVDHIDGIRNNNKLKNLRWVTNVENTQNGAENRKNITNYINILIQKFGYEETEQKLKQILEE